jgi:ferredoxin-NADP reductase
MNPDTPSELVFYIRHQSGFTARLYAQALENPDVSVPVLVDGPYGGVDLQRYRDSDHVLVVAGGSGAGWCLAFVERFLRSAVPQIGSNGLKYEQGVASGDIKEAPAVEELSSHRSSGPLSLRIILATRDISSRTWFLRTVGELLAKYPTAQVSRNMRVQVYLTGDAAHEVDLTSSHGAHNHNHSQSSPTPSNSSIDRIEVPVKGHDESIPGREYAEGRPHLRTIIAEETAKSMEVGESLGVYICGPLTMQNDVRNAVAQENLNIVKGGNSGGVYLHSEHFSWA